MSIPDYFIRELLDRVDIVDVVQRYVSLKKKGVNFFGLCPFHQEKSPSFSVHPTKQIFKCFGCGESGDALEFVRKHLHLDFVPAIHELASIAGVMVPEEKSRIPVEQKKAQEKARLTLLDVMEKAHTFYKQQLKKTPIAIQYLKDRGLTGEIAARFGLGYAPNDWTALKEAFEDYNAKELKDSGLVIERQEENPKYSEAHYDRFRDRIMFPIRNTKGNVIAFGARLIGSGKPNDPKYLNSNETELYHKGKELYGLYEGQQAIREKGYALVVEGYMDVVALAQGGFSQAVATLGTACTKDQITKLFRYTNHIIFSFDGDIAGQKAAEKAFENVIGYVTEKKRASFLFLPTEHDPDSYIREYGSDAFEQYLQKAKPFSEFFFTMAKEGLDLSQIEGKALAQTKATPYLSAMQDSPLKLQIQQKLSELLGIAKEDLIAQTRPSKTASGRKKEWRRVPRLPMPELSRQIIYAFLRYPELLFHLDDQERTLMDEISAEDSQILDTLLNGMHAIDGDLTSDSILSYITRVDTKYDSLIEDLKKVPNLSQKAIQHELTGAWAKIRKQLKDQEVTEALSATDALENREYIHTLLAEQKRLNEEYENFLKNDPNN